MVFQSCPISAESRNENVVRAVAGIVVFIAAVAVAAGSAVAAILFAALAVDFSVRGFGKPKYSPLAGLGRAIANILGLPPKPVNAAPKRFAARIGTGMSIAAALFYAAGTASVAAGIAAVLIVCATLEAAFGFCVGCKVYALLPRRVSQLLAG